MHAILGNTYVDGSSGAKVPFRMKCTIRRIKYVMKYTVKKMLFKIWRLLCINLKKFMQEKFFSVYFITYFYPLKTVDWLSKVYIFFKSFHQRTLLYIVHYESWYRITDIFTFFRTLLLLWGAPPATTVIIFAFDFRIRDCHLYGRSSSTLMTCQVISLCNTCRET